MGAILKSVANFFVHKETRKNIGKGQERDLLQVPFHCRNKDLSFATDLLKLRKEPWLTMKFFRGKEKKSMTFGFSRAVKTFSLRFYDARYDLALEALFGGKCLLLIFYCRT